MVVGRSLRDGGVHIVADVGRGKTMDAAGSDSAAPAQAEPSSRIGSLGEQTEEAMQGLHFATVKLRPGIDTVIIGSDGLW